MHGLMTPQMFEFIEECIANNREIMFYKTTEWKRLRQTVLRMDKRECQMCKERGLHVRATHVHHVKPLKLFPELALSLVHQGEHGEERQLVSLCHACHEQVHGHRVKNRNAPLTRERW